MALLSFNPKYRRIWMFPRNIRNIAPWKIYQILTVLMKCSDLDLKDGADQKYVYKMLNEAGIKGKANTRDKNPGGMRTYYAQLGTLGLVYENSEGKFRYTIAGQTIADEDNPLRVLQYQLLRHQYPSAYGHGQNVCIDPRLKVKPFMFLLRLLQDDRLENYMTSQEMIIPVIYGHNDDCYEFCVEKIQEVREKDGDVASAISDFELDLYTPRSGFGKNLGNVGDIANTAKNYLQACSLIIVNGEKIGGKETYSFNPMYMDLYNQMLKESDDYISCKDDSESESFQRAYGRYNKVKDTRSETETSVDKESPEQSFIKFRYVLFANDNLFVDDEKPFYDSMGEMGITASAVAEAVAPYKTKRRSIDENNFLEYANSGGSQAEEFEKALTNLFKSIGFSDSYWIGRRKSEKNWRGNFPDVFIKKPYSDDVGFADAKASSKYSLGHDDMLKMRETYVGSNKELAPDSTLRFFIYIAGGFRGDINTSVNQLATATNIPVTAMDARTALKLVDLHAKGWTADRIEKEVLKRGGFITEDELILLGR